MSVPKFTALMLPLLTLIADGEEHRVNDVAPILAEQLGLSDAERAETIPSATSRFKNRGIVHDNGTWTARGYLRDGTPQRTELIFRCFDEKLPKSQPLARRIYTIE